MTTKPPPLPPITPSPRTVSPVRRHLFWLVPLFLLSILGMAAIGYFAYRTLDQSEKMSAPAYDAAKQAARGSPRAIAELGEPLKFTGKVGTFSGDDYRDPTHAELELMATGPKNAGVLFATAEKRAETWHVTALTLALDEHEHPIDLLAPESGESQNAR